MHFDEDSVYPKIYNQENARGLWDPVPVGIVPPVATSMAPEKEPRPPSQGSEEGGGDGRNIARNRALSGGLGTHS